MPDSAEVDLHFRRVATNISMVTPRVGGLGHNCHVRGNVISNRKPLSASPMDRKWMMSHDRKYVKLRLETLETG